MLTVVAVIKLAFIWTKLNLLLPYSNKIQIINSNIIPFYLNNKSMKTLNTYLYILP